MAIFDPVEQRVTVRVVYDGVACAGKTTNLRQLCTLFAAGQAGALYSPEDMHGRTLFFDWLQITAGVVCGFPLLCQVVSVPGQLVLTPRRRHLLSTADVVVYVCESRPDSIARARSGLGVYDEIARTSELQPPLVIQANKQDQAGALGGAAVLSALGRESSPVVEAIACDGVGVVDTFVTAVRTVARAIRKRTEEGDLRVEVRRSESSARLFERLSRQAIDPEWAAELLLEEAQAAFLLDEAMAAMAADARARKEAQAAAREIAALAHDDEPPRSEAPPAESELPPLPSADVPTGFIWPAHTGRAAIRSLDLDKRGPMELDPGGRITVSIDGRRLRTSRANRHPDGESARQALVRAARLSSQLERLLVPETVLVAQSVHGGACWLWTIQPELRTLEELADAGALGRGELGVLGEAIVELIRTGARHGFEVDISLASFGIDRGILRYVGELSAHVATEVEPWAGISRVLTTLEARGLETSSLCDAIERQLARRSTTEPRALPRVSEARGILPRGHAGDRLFAAFSRASQG